MKTVKQIGTFLRIIFLRCLTDFYLLQIQGKNSQITVMKKSSPAFEDSSNKAHFFVDIYNEEVGPHIGANIFFDFDKRIYVIRHYYFPNNNGERIVILEAMDRWNVPNCLTLFIQQKPEPLKNLLRGESFDLLITKFNQYFNRCKQSWQKINNVEVRAT